MISNEEKPALAQQAISGATGENDLSLFEYFFFTDGEYFALSEEKEEELDNSHERITKPSYTVYYRKIAK